MPIPKVGLEGGCLSDQLFLAMRQSIIDGAPDAATQLAQRALVNGIDPLEAVNQGFAIGITFAGDQFGRAKCFCPICLPRPRP